MNKKHAVICSLFTPWSIAVVRRFYSTGRVVCLGLFSALPSKAASLQLVPSWGASGVPTNLSMYIYVPDKLAANPPILVLLHYWGGGASGIFAEAQGSGIVAAADEYGFILVVPQNPDCWDVNSTATLTHDGGGHTQGIAQMVKYAINTYQANSDRVYVTGTSCGAMMTEAMLAVYPDMFKAGAAFAGQVVGGAWTPITHTAQQWGNIVRGAYPGYSGPRPRVQIWHGMADDIINFSNQPEAVLQWTDVLGLSANPTLSTTVTLYNHQWLRQIWLDSHGATALDAWSEYNGPHGTDANLNALNVIPFMGLNGVSLTYPWMSLDLGAAGVPGSAACSNGVFAVTGSGADIWNAADAMQFDYVPVAGNCTIVARVAAVQNIDAWSKAGVMIRESLNANAANAFIAVTPSNGVSWQARSSAGGSTVNIATGGLSAPYWVKLVRSGNTFTGYRSPDGVTWTPQGTNTFSIASTVYVGLALTSHNNSSLGTATFDNVTAPGWQISQALVPAGLSATPVSASQINLTWNTLTNATSYNVKRSTTNGGPFAVIASGVTGTNYQDGGLPVNTINSYFYVVSAVASGGETPDSALATAAVPWTPQDVGPVGASGGASLTNGVFTLTGSGADIQNTGDAFQFTYQPVTGNCTIVARVVSVQNIDSWSKAGVMIRESLATNAANAFIAVTPSNGVTWQNRSTTGGTTSYTTTGSLNAPYWVKLVRIGSVFTGYRSPDGVTWTPQRTNTFAMASTAYIGLALTSHNNSSLGTATFDNVTAPGWPISQNPVPGGLSATPVSSSQINLLWNVFSNTASYNIKRSTTNGGSYALIASGLTATNYSDGGLAGGTIYYYVVSAVVSGSETSNSVQTAVATLAGSYGALLHRYSFSESGGSSVADPVGGPVWNGSLPNGGTLGGGQLTLSAGPQQYAGLSAGIVGGLSNFTVVAWVNLNSPTNWSRIFDFGSNTTTNMFLTPQNGNTGTLRFAITTNGGGNEQQINCSTVFTTGVWHQVAVTLNGETGILYLDGIAAGTNSSMTLNPASLGNTGNNNLGKSQYADPYLNGSLDEFRIYNIGLSPAEIAATTALGHNQLLSTNSPPMNLALTGVNLTMSWPLANAGYTLQARTNLFSGSWVNVSSPAPQILGGNWQVLLPRPVDNSPVFYRLSK